MALHTDSHAEAARRLLFQERAGAEAADWSSAAGRVYELLVRHLAPVLGSAGVRALFARAVKLNKGGSPCLARVRIASCTHDEDVGVAQQLVVALSTLDREGSLEAASALYATFFALLTMFIGERLTWRILQRAFGDHYDRATSKETQR